MFNGNRKIFIGILLVCSFFLVEFFLRIIGFGDPPIVILDPEVEYYLKPSTSYDRFGNRVEINRYGMRSPDFDKSDVQNKKIYVLGDSVVYGNHFLDQEETISYRLCHLISNRKEKFICGSIAASSWGPANILAFYRRFGPFKGDFTFLVQSSHDRTDTPFASPNITPYRTAPSYMAITDFLLAIAEKCNLLTPEINNIKDLSFEKKLEATERDLTELIRLTKLDSKSVFLIFHPTKSETIESHSESNAASGFFKVLAENEKIHFINMITEYRMFLDPENLYQDNIHLSETGAAHFAKILERYISRE